MSLVVNDQMHFHEDDDDEEDFLSPAPPVNRSILYT